MILLTPNTDMMLVAFIGLLGASLGFIMRHFLVHDVKPQILDIVQKKPKEELIFKNSGITTIEFSDTDNGEENPEFNFIGDKKAQAQILQALNCNETNILQTIIENDEKTATQIYELRTKGKSFETFAKGIEIIGFTYDAHACLNLKLAPANYGARGTNEITTPVWKTDKDGKLIWGNNAFINAVEAQDLETAIDEDMRFDAKAQIDAIAAAKGNVIKDTRAVSIGGQRRMMRIISAPAFDGALSIAVDINDEIQVQETLKREAKAHVETLNHLTDAVAVFDNSRHLETYNRAFANLWGLEAIFLDDKPSNEEIYDRLRAKSWLPAKRNYNEWRAEQIAYYQQTSAIPDETWPMPDGRILRVMRQRQPTGGLLILFEDISDKTSLQAKFKTQIEVSNATLDRLQEGVAVFKSDGRLTLANRAFLDIWALDSDFANRALEFNEFAIRAANIYPDDEFWNDLFARIGDPTPAGRRETNGEIFLKNQRVLNWLTRPLPDGATMVAFNDVSAQHHIATVLREKALALAEADKLKTAFLEKVSYQLRTPLTTISGYSEILLTGIGGELSQLQNEYLNAVRQASEQLSKMVGDLLDLAVIDAGHAPLDIGEVELKNVLAQAQEISSSKLTHSQISIEIEEDDGGIILGDDKKIRQIMFNLVHNAMRNLQSGDIIKIGAKRVLDNVRLYVTAPNHNIDPLSTPLEFEAFTEGSRQGGLGLVLVKKFVELHGGWIAMGSKDPQSMTITCHLPLNAKNNQANPQLELL